MVIRQLVEVGEAVEPTTLQSVVSTVKTNRKRKPSEGAKQPKRSKGVSLVLEPTNAIADVQSMQRTATAPTPAINNPAPAIVNELNLTTEMAKPSPTLANAYEDIDTMANSLDLQDKNSDTTDKAKKLFKEIHRSKELKG